MRWTAIKSMLNGQSCTVLYYIRYWQPSPVDPYSAICDDHTYCTNVPRLGMKTTKEDIDRYPTRHRVNLIIILLSGWPPMIW